jgi:hypothetical protein
MKGGGAKSQIIYLLEDISNIVKVKRIICRFTENYHERGIMITRNRTTTALSLAAVAMAMLVLTTTLADAALVVEEQFIYEPAMLDTLNGGTGFDGPWVATKSHGRDYFVGLTEFADQKPLNEDSGLSFSTLRVAGSALSRFGSAGRAEAHRMISAASQAALTRDNTTIWFSQLFAGPAANRGAMFIFGTQPLNHTNLHTMAAPGSGFGFSIHNPSDGPISAVAFNNSVDATIESGVLYTPDPITAVSLIVGKINWKPNGTPDEYFLFNVTDLTTEPAESEAIASITNLDFDQADFNLIALCDGTNSVTDEIRFGTSFADVMGVLKKASNPGPEDGAMLEAVWITLSWSPGASAISHDVYMGDNFDDVNNANRDSDLFRGNQDLDSLFYFAGFAPGAYPDGLVSGTTYYWRIDEVNDADPKSPWKGDVWSFTVPSNKAYEPIPSDGGKFIEPDNLILTWTPGFKAVMHTVYFGDDYDTVANATEGEEQISATLSPGPLEKEKTYYWRVDELNEAQSTHTGDVWSFSTMPDIPITDPNLVGWWKFEVGTGNRVIDFSGHGNHGTIVDKVRWVPGQFNLALEFLGDNQGHVELPPRIVTTASGSVAMWVKTDQAGIGDAYAEGMFWYGTETGGDGFGDQNEIHIHNQGSGTLGFWMGGATPVSLDGPKLAGTGWNHVAATWDQTDGCRLYFNGVQVDFQIYTGNVVDLAVIRLGRPAGNFRFHKGLLDDVRLFDHAITAEQVNEIMTKGEDPLKAGAPSPGNGSVATLTATEILTWSAGEGATQHDVYFGTDHDAVANATADSPEFQGNQAQTSLSIAGMVEFGGGDYYWRVDEITDDGTVTTGMIWMFTVPDYLIVDDFEAYDVGNNEIWWSWKDGLGYAEHDNEPAYPGNGTGSAVGDETSYTYMEMTIVHSGGKSMPLWYDNNKQNFAKYSEVELTLPDGQRDWTVEGIGELSLWFRGETTNTPEPLYVVVSNPDGIGTGGPAVVVHDDPSAATTGTWAEWVIPIQIFVDQGINLTDVDRIAIGLGTKGNMTIPGGSGKMYFDDIRLYRPRDIAAE